MSQKEYFSTMLSSDSKKVKQRPTFGISRRDRIPKEEIRRRTRLTDAIERNHNV